MCSGARSSSANGAIAAQGDLETLEGRAAIERFFANGYAGPVKGPPKILSGKGHSFSDVAKKVVSIINLGSLKAIEDVVGQPHVVERQIDGKRNEPVERLSIDVPEEHVGTVGSAGRPCESCGVDSDLYSLNR